MQERDGSRQAVLHFRILIITYHTNLRALATEEFSGGLNELNQRLFAQLVQPLLVHARRVQTSKLLENQLII
jgi:hypothetical protein